MPTLPIKAWITETVRTPFAIDFEKWSDIGQALRKVRPIRSVRFERKAVTVDLALLEDDSERAVRDCVGGVVLAVVMARNLLQPVPMAPPLSADELEAMGG